MYFVHINHFRPAILAVFGFACLQQALTAAELRAEDHPVIELALRAEEGTNVSFVTKRALPLYVGRRAGRVLDVLAAGQALTVLAMDRYGLKVRGNGRNGPLTGWVGQKTALAGDEKQLSRLRAFYERELEIDRLVSEKRPAIGMNLSELKRILGKPTTHKVGATPEGRTDALTWVIKREIDLNEFLGVGTDAEILKPEVETGRIEVELADGLAGTVTMKIDGGAAEIPTVVPPIEEPFGPAPKDKLAGK